MAERVGFEPTVRYRTLDFESYTSSRNQFLLALIYLRHALKRLLYQTFVFHLFLFYVKHYPLVCYHFVITNLLKAFYFSKVLLYTYMYYLNLYFSLSKFGIVLHLLKSNTSFALSMTSTKSFDKTDVV